MAPHAPYTLPGFIQDLPPRWAHFCLHIEKFVVGTLGLDLAGARLVVGFSGGADSTALLILLHCLAKKNSGQIIACHLDHVIRPESADDARWCAELCAALGVEFRVERVDVPALAADMSVGLEEAGREARYAFFERVRLERDATHVAVAHHLDDLCEDVLMRLTRGTAWPGLAGMAGVDPKRHLVRPLLLMRKAELVSFLSDISVEWRDDHTNQDVSMTRNRVRHSLLPLLLEENPNFPESVARMWQVGQIDQEYWAGMIPASGDTLEDSLLNSAHPALRLRLYKAFLDRLGPGQALADTLFNLDAAWQERRVGAVLQFPGKKTATVRSHGIVFGHSH